MTPEEQKPQQTEIRPPIWNTEDYQGALIRIPDDAAEFYAPQADLWFKVIAPENLSLDRRMILEEKLNNFFFVKETNELISDISKIFDLTNSPGDNKVNIGVLAFNLLWSLRNQAQRRHFAAQMCSVFIISEKCSEWEFKQTLADENIKIWRREFESDFFIQSAVHLCGGHKAFATRILEVFLGREVMEHYLKTRANLLNDLIFKETT